MTGLNVCVGIDAGSFESKLAYSDELSTRIIAVLEGLDMNALREEAEGFFDEPVFLCVAAVPENFTRIERDNLKIRATACGFNKTEIIPEHEAIILALGECGRTLIYDLGYSGCRIFMIDGENLIDSAIVDDVCGREFERKFGEYLAERCCVEAVDTNDIRRIRHTLSSEEPAVWREVKIFRDELDRLEHFAVKRSARVLARMERVYVPERVILTGGNVKSPSVWRVIEATLRAKPEYRGNIVAEGAASMARTLQKGSVKAERADNSAGIRKLRGEIIGLEEILTRRQKDRIYAMFRQAEGINDAGIISLMENLIRDIRNA